MNRIVRSLPDTALILRTTARTLRSAARLATLPALAATALLALPGTAAATGTLVTANGAAVVLEASRNLLVRGDQTIELFTQIKYTGAQGKMVWLIAVPNVNNARDNGARVTLAEGSLFEALDVASRPVLSAACEGNPNGTVEEVLQRPEFGPVPTANVATRIFEAAEIQAGALDTYLTDTQGLTISEAVAGAIADSYDQNLMFVAVELDPAVLGVDKVDPAVRISLPLGDAEPFRLGTRPLTANAAPADGKVDLVIWTLANGRAGGSLNNRELDFETVNFSSATATNYTEAFDADVARLQTQAFITEFADVQAGFEQATLEGLRAVGSNSYFTRLRGRMLPAIFRTNARTLDFTVSDSGAYARAHTVAAFDCGGPAADMGPELIDRGIPADFEPDTDGGTGESDAGGTTSIGNDGGDDGGCSAVATSPASGGGVLALFLVLGGLIRRRRGL
jgi:MYXO-CTERM domain-containing protein